MFPEVKKQVTGTDDADITTLSAFDNYDTVGNQTIEETGIALSVTIYVTLTAMLY